MNSSAISGCTPLVVAGCRTNSGYLRPASILLTFTVVDSSEIPCSGVEPKQDVVAERDSE
eukprot:2625757-Rhodomonas_salina.1